MLFSSSYHDEKCARDRLSSALWFYVGKARVQNLIFSMNVKTWMSSYIQTHLDLVGMKLRFCEYFHTLLIPVKLVKGKKHRTGKHYFQVLPSTAYEKQIHKWLLGWFLHEDTWPRANKNTKLSCSAFTVLLDGDSIKALCEEGAALNLTLFTCKLGRWTLLV